MAKKSKTKTDKNRKLKKYPVYYLGAVLMFVLVLEGILFGLSTSADWQKAATVLDVSSGVSEATQDTTETFQPMTDQVQSIEQFYQISADQMTQLVDLSDNGVGSEIGFIYYGISDFYLQASVQMAQLLDVSNTFSRNY